MSASCMQEGNTVLLIDSLQAFIKVSNTWHMFKVCGIKHTQMFLSAFIGYFLTLESSQILLLLKDYLGI